MDFEVIGVFRGISLDLRHRGLTTVNYENGFTGYQPVSIEFKFYSIERKNMDFS